MRSRGVLRFTGIIWLIRFIVCGDGREREALGSKLIKRSFNILSLDEDILVSVINIGKKCLRIILCRRFVCFNLVRFIY